jgi:hypothetical protein
MMRSVSARLLRIAVISFAAFVTLPGASARAATLPANAEVHAGQCVAATAFRQLVSARYQVEFQQVVATDIDRDGDIDVLATTDRSFTVWINDGAGHLTSSRTASGPSIERQPWSNVLGGHDGPPQPPANTDAPTTAVLTDRAHAPPVLATTRAARRVRAAASLFLVSSSAPRAPPLG